MSVKTILACLSDPGSARALLPAATALAARFGAHLIGLHPMRSLVIYPTAGVYMPEPTLVVLHEERRAEAAAIEAGFAEATRGAGARGYTAEWRLGRPDTPEAGEEALGSARAADLVLAARGEAAAPGAGLRELIRAAGRPVLVVPDRGIGAGVGRRALVGWSDTREAARAVHDALALLEEGASMRLVRAGGRGGDEMADWRLADLCAALARRGVRAEAVQRPEARAGAAEILRREAAEWGADLMVCGAYGHSRAYDFVIGAVTEDLLREAELPVLLAK